MECRADGRHNAETETNTDGEEGVVRRAMVLVSEHTVAFTPSEGPNLFLHLRVAATVLWGSLRKSDPTILQITP